MEPNRRIWNPTGQYVAIQDDMQDNIGPYRTTWSDRGLYGIKQDDIEPYKMIWSHTGQYGVIHVDIEP